MGQRAVYRIREKGQDIFAYSHWSGVISPFSRLNKAKEWQMGKPGMSLTDILLRLCDSETLYDPAVNTENSPYFSVEAGLNEFFNVPPTEWGDIEMLIEMDLDKSEVSYRFDPRTYSHLMNTTVNAGEGMKIFSEVLEEYHDKVDNPADLWAYNLAFTERIITPCTITNDNMLERMKSGDVDFIRGHIWRFSNTDRWGYYSTGFNDLFAEACHMPKGDNQMLEAVTDVFKRRYYSGVTNYEAVKNAAIHTVTTDDFERFKLIYDNLPKWGRDKDDNYKESVTVELMRHGYDTYALYGLKNGVEPQEYPWMLNRAVGNRCTACRDFLLSKDIVFKGKEHAERTVDLLYKAAKARDSFMLAELKKQGIPMNYKLSGAFFTCMYANDPGTAIVLVEHGGDLDKFRKVFERGRFTKYLDKTEFFKIVEHGGELDAAEPNNEAHYGEWEDRDGFDR